jgi:OOP family OmpA-OmpF porin
MNMANLGLKPAVGALLLALMPWVQAQNAAPGAAPVVVSGVVPDEATKAAILARARELYGAQRVVDQLGIGNLAAPPNWAQQVVRLMPNELKQVTQGELRVRGTVVELQGRVDSAAIAQQVPALLNAQLLNSTYQVRSGLRVDSPGQAQLDAALANRIVEFDPGRDTLTDKGARTLDELLPVLQKFNGRRFEVIGHTDSDGGHAANLALSLARAEAVKAYLVQRGIAAQAISTQGAGPDRPVADNSTPEGRSRNRRIEFRVLA